MTTTVEPAVNGAMIICVADIKLGYNTGYWSAGPPAGALEAREGG